MKKVLILLTICVLFNMPKINALKDGCTPDEMSRLKLLAQKTDITYDQIKDNTFSVTILNMLSDIYAKDNKNIVFKVSPNESAVTIDASNYDTFSYTGGNTYIFNYYASENSICSGEYLTQKTIRLKVYNIFSESNECSTDPSFMYCAKFLDSYISDTQFNSAYSKYLKDKNTEGNNEDKPIDNKKEDKDVVTNVMKFVLSYYYIIIPIIAIPSITAVYLIKYYKHKKIGF